MSDRAGVAVVAVSGPWGVVLVFLGWSLMWAGWPADARYARVSQLLIDVGAVVATLGLLVMGLGVVEAGAR